MDRPQGQKRVKRRITKELSWNSKGTGSGGSEGTVPRGSSAITNITRFGQGQRLKPVYCPFLAATVAPCGWGGSRIGTGTAVLSCRSRPHPGCPRGRRAPGAEFPGIREVLGSHLDVVEGPGLQVRQGVGRQLVWPHLGTAGSVTGSRQLQPQLCLSLRRIVAVPWWGRSRCPGNSGCGTGAGNTPGRARMMEGSTPAAASAAHQGQGRPAGPQGGLALLGRQGMREFQNGLGGKGP